MSLQLRRDDWKRVWRTARNAHSHRLPERYEHDAWVSPFESRVAAALSPNCRVLDVGSGRRPVVAPGKRPPGCSYVGLDVSAAEFEEAPPGSYDEVVVADVACRVDRLDQSFDLIVSAHVFEHVKGLPTAVEHLRCYLRPNGRLVSFFAGKFAAPSLFNVAIPDRVGAVLVSRMMRRPAATVFPAHYDRCYYGALTQMLRDWEAVEIVPAWGGAVYFNFSRLLQSAYLAYEEWARLGTHPNLATHYLVAATR